MMAVTLKPVIKSGLLASAFVLFSGCANQMYVPIFEAGEDPDLRKPTERPSTPSPAPSPTHGSDQPESAIPEGIGDKTDPPIRQIVEPETVEKANMGKPRSKAVDKLLAQSQTYLDQSNYRQSTLLAERALRIQPGLIDAYYLLASNKMRQGQWRSALQFANKGLQQRGRQTSLVEKLNDIARQAKAMMD